MDPTPVSASARPRPLLTRSVLVSAAVTATALLVVAVSSVVLLGRFTPDLAIDDVRSAVTRGPRYAPRRWVTVHEGALFVAVVASLAWATLTSTLGRHRSRRAAAIAVGTAATAVAGSLAAALSWPLVRWDQVALDSVTVGQSFVGLWKPAVSEQVLFVLVGGDEVGQAAYLARLVLHLAAPAVALVAMGASMWTARRSTGR